MDSSTALNRPLTLKLKLRSPTYQESASGSKRRLYTFCQGLSDEEASELRIARQKQSKGLSLGTKSHTRPLPSPKGSSISPKLCVSSQLRKNIPKQGCLPNEIAGKENRPDLINSMNANQPVHRGSKQKPRTWINRQKSDLPKAKTNHPLGGKSLVLNDCKNWTVTNSATSNSSSMATTMTNIPLDQTVTVPHSEVAKFTHKLAEQKYLLDKRIEELQKQMEVKQQSHRITQNTIQRLKQQLGEAKERQQAIKAERNDLWECLQYARKETKNKQGDSKHQDNKTKLLVQEEQVQVNLMEAEYNRSFAKMKKELQLSQKSQDDLRIKNIKLEAVLNEVRVKADQQAKIHRIELSKLRQQFALHLQVCSNNHTLHNQSLSFAGSDIFAAQNSGTIGAIESSRAMSTAYTPSILPLSIQAEASTLRMKLAHLTLETAELREAYRCVREQLTKLQSNSIQSYQSFQANKPEYLDLQDLTTFREPQKYKEACNSKFDINSGDPFGNSLIEYQHDSSLSEEGMSIDKGGKMSIDL